MTDDSNQPERPRAEPEIIPPDRNRSQPDWRQPDWRQTMWRPYGSTGPGGTHRVYITRLGPFGIAMLMLVFAVLFAVTILAILGAALIWIPAVALFVVGAAIYRHLRR
jgi:fatty acid desaturase